MLLNELFSFSEPGIGTVKAVNLALSKPTYQSSSHATGPASYAVGTLFILPEGKNWTILE